MIIAIDHGNSSIKTAHYTFLSALEMHANRPPMANDILEYNGSFWTMTGQRIPYMMDKTKDDRFFILSLFAIAKEMLHSGHLSPGADIDLAVGLPPEHFSLMRERFTRYLNRGEIQFSYNDMPARINIKNVFVYPQAYAAVVPQSVRLKNEPRIFIIDIGGVTTDVLLLKNGAPDLHYCRSLETGIITMTNAIIGKVNAQFGIKLAEEQIIAVLQGSKNLILEKSVVDYIHSHAKQHAEAIIDELREHKVELKANPAIFIGGGAILFKPLLEHSSMIAHAEFVVDERANAIGYELLATHQQMRGGV